MLRRGDVPKNEEACEQWSTQNVELCADRQDEILDCAASMLAGGGRLVYSTCTFAPAEDEGSIGDSRSGIQNLRGGGAACGGNVARTGRTFRDDPSVVACFAGKTLCGGAACKEETLADGGSGLLKNG